MPAHVLVTGDQVSEWDQASRIGECQPELFPLTQSKFIPIEKSSKPPSFSVQKFDGQFFNRPANIAASSQNCYYTDVSETNLNGISRNDFAKIRSASTLLKSLHPDQISYSTDVWIKLPSHKLSTEVEKQGYQLIMVDNEYFIKSRVIFDTGSQNSLMADKLFDNFAYQTTSESVSIVGLEGKKHKAVPGVVTFRSCNGRNISIPVYRHPFNVKDDQLKNQAAEILAKYSFNTETEIFNKPSSRIDVLIGKESMSLHPKVLSPQDLAKAGFRYPIESPNLTLSVCELATDAFIISGAFGLNPDIAELPYTTITIPDTTTFNILTCSYESEKTEKLIIGKPKYVSFRRKKLATVQEEQNIDSGPVIGQLSQVPFENALEIEKISHTLVVTNDNLISDCENVTVSEAASILKKRDQIQTRNDIRKINLMSSSEILLETNQLPHQGSIKQEDRLIEVNNEIEPFHFLSNTENTLEKNTELMHEYLKNQLKIKAEIDICLNHLDQTFKCVNCQHSSEMSVEDLRHQEAIAKNMQVIPIQGTDKKYFLFHYFVKDDPNVVFNPENSNYGQALSNAIQVRRKLIKMGENMLDRYHATFTEAVELGFMAQLTPQEEESLKTRNHFFIHQNVVQNIHSSSTPLRRVSDTSRPIQHKFTTHSAQIASPQGCLSNLTQCQLRFILRELKLSEDISKAYKRIKIDEPSQYLCLTLWYKDPHNPKTITIYRDMSVAFGIAQAAQILALCTQYCAEKMVRPAARETTMCSMLADDLKDSRAEIDQMLADTEEIRRVFEQHSLPMKASVTNLWVNPNQLDNESKEALTCDTFGTIQNYATQTMTPSTYLSIFPSKRGKPGLSLDKTDIFAPMVVLTLRILTRVSASLFDITGQMLSILIATAKRWISKVHMKNPESSIQWDKDIRLFAPDLDKKLRVFLHSLKGLKQEIKPFLNFVIPYKYKFRYLIICRDGSQSGSSICAHLISKRVNGAVGPKFFSYILFARDQISTNSIPVNEASSLRLSMESLSIIMKSIYSKIESDTQLVKVYLLGDAKALSFNLSQNLVIRHIAIRNRVNASRMQALQLTQKYKKLCIYTGWIPGKFNISDLNSKITDDPIKHLNSKEWRHGHSFFLNRSKVEEHLFWNVKNGKEFYKALPLSFVNTKEEKDKLNVYDVAFENRVKSGTPPCPKRSKLEKSIFENFQKTDQQIVSDHHALFVKQNATLEPNIFCDELSESSQSLIASCNSKTMTEDFNFLANQYLNAEYQVSQAMKHALLIQTRKQARILRNRDDKRKKDINPRSKMVDTTFEDDRMSTIVNFHPKQPLKVKVDDYQQTPSIANIKDRVNNILPSIPRNPISFSAPQNPILPSSPQSPTLPSVSKNPVQKHELSTYSPQSSSVKDDLHIYRANSTKSDLLGRVDIKLIVSRDYKAKVTHINSYYRIIEAASDHNIQPLLGPHLKSVYKGLIFTGDEYIKHITRYQSWNKIVRIGFVLFLAIFVWKFKIKRRKGLFKHRGYGVDLLSDHGVCYQEISQSNGPWLLLDSFNVVSTYWVQILLCDQKYFMLPKPKLNDIRVNSSAGIIGRVNRMSDNDNIALFGTQFIPILARNSPLLNKIVQHCHLTKNPQNPCLFLHLNPSVTTKRVKSNLYSVTTINIQRFLQIFFSNCSGCLRVIGNNFSRELGPNVITFDHSIIPWSRISIDPLAPIFCKITENSRYRVKVVPLAINCLLVGQLAVILMTDATRDSVKQTLQLFMIRTGVKVTHILCDHAAIFSNITEMFPGVILNVVPARSQHRNRVERSIGILRSVWRRLTRKSTREPDREIYSFNMLTILLEVAVNTVNEIPYSKGNFATPINPDFFRRPNLYVLLNYGDIERNDLQIYELLSRKVSEFLKECISIRNLQLTNEDKKYRKIHYKGIVEPKEGDIAFIKNIQNFESARLVVIENLKNQTANVRFANGRKADFAVKDLHPLVCLREPRDEVAEKEVSRDTVPGSRPGCSGAQVVLD